MYIYKYIKPLLLIIRWVNLLVLVALVVGFCLSIYVYIYI